ncbi:hypothetical protein BDN72DRAFT_261473 [Pluteus cervinus]|uniref:Uncharacterized protein n=1 Tax=Pluteus cervinus TaxID=181527 RepID=A0ACD3AFU4_9AGAR|nr:hypothetical protein BDN72DRAFT_261473 [Pluteus cervinus]
MRHSSQGKPNPDLWDIEALALPIRRLCITVAVMAAAAVDKAVLPADNIVCFQRFDELRWNSCISNPAACRNPGLEHRMNVTVWWKGSCCGFELKDLRRTPSSKPGESQQSYDTKNMTTRSKVLMV